MPLPCGSACNSHQQVRATSQRRSPWRRRVFFRCSPVRRLRRIQRGISRTTARHVARPKSYSGRPRGMDTEPISSRGRHHQTAPSIRVAAVFVSIPKQSLRNAVLIAQSVLFQKCDPVGFFNSHAATDANRPQPALMPKAVDSDPRHLCRFPNFLQCQKSLDRLRRRCLYTRRCGRNILDTHGCTPLLLV